MSRISMKALRTYKSSDPEEGVGGKVRAGREITVAGEDRARALETSVPPLAVRIAGQSQTTAAPAENKAAQTGPLTSTGGRTGAVQPRTSLRVDHPQATKQTQSVASQKVGSAKAKSASQSSTKAGA